MFSSGKDEHTVSTAGNLLLGECERSDKHSGTRVSQRRHAQLQHMITSTTTLTEKTCQSWSIAALSYGESLPNSYITTPRERARERREESERQGETDTPRTITRVTVRVRRGVFCLVMSPVREGHGPHWMPVGQGSWQGQTDKDELPPGGTEMRDAKCSRLRNERQIGGHLAGAS